MNLTETVLYILLISLGMFLISFPIINFFGIYNIKLSKIQFDIFLEDVKQEAIQSSKRRKIFYNHTTGIFIVSTGGKFEDFPGTASQDCIFGFEDDGSFFIEKGSTTFSFEDGSSLVIMPVTGRVVY